MPAVQINFITRLIPIAMSLVKMNLVNWSAPNIWVSIAQLVEYCSANAEVMSSNPVEALIKSLSGGLKFAIP